MKKKRLLSMVMVLAMAISLFAGCSSSSAETSTEDEAWMPSQPITILVLAAAGGGADISCRLLATYAEEYLGQSIVIQNVSGGGGSIALQQLITSEPDGYTLAYMSPPKSNNDLLLEGVDTTIDDYTAIAKFSSDPNIITISKDLGVDNFNDFLGYVESNPGAVTYGLAGSWGNGEFLRIKLEDDFGIEFKRMVFDSGTLAATSVAAGDCAASAPFYVECIAQLDADNLIPVAVTSEERLDLLPDVPTVAELTGTDFSWYVWRGIVGPADMDENIVATLSAAIEYACSNEEYQEKALEYGICTDFQDYNDFAEFFLEDHLVYREMIENNSF